MLFLHEFVDYPGAQGVDNGWWEYNPDRELLFNRNGGYHSHRYHPKEEIIESTWEEILYLSIRDDSYITGWIAPDGTFYGCAPMDHVRLAEYYLKTKENKLEEDGWLKITQLAFFTKPKPDNPNGRYEYLFFNPYKYITQAQYKTMRQKGLELTEYDKQYNLAQGDEEN